MTDIDLTDLFILFSAKKGASLATDYRKSNLANRMISLKVRNTYAA